MKKLLSIIVALAMLLSMATMVSAATADIVNVSVEGTATIDGTKDDIYASGLVLPIIQKGTNNGGGEVLADPIANAYIVNDANYVYWFVEVFDATLDNSSANTYEQDSVEIFYMADNSKVQLRFCYDGNVGADSGVAPAAGEDYVITQVDGGYTLEYRMPITDVLANQLETCIQINYCSEGKRDHTTYILGNGDADNAYQRSNRQKTEYDVWWTLTLAGEHADTRVDPKPEPMELTPKNYTVVQNIPVGAQLFAQDQVAWSWIGVGSYTGGATWNTPLVLDWQALAGPVFDESTTANWTKDPKFRISIGNDQFLAIDANAEVGSTGDSGSFVYSYTDIIIKAEGYADVIIPAGTVAGDLTVKMESWGRSGDTLEIDLVEPIKAQLGLDTQGLCTYLTAVNSVTTTITLTSYNLVDQAVMDAYLVQLDAEDQALIVELQEYADKVAAALETAKGTTDVAVMEEAADDAQKAVNRATKEAEGYPKATEWATALQTSVDEINALIEAAKAAAEAPAETPEETPDEPAETPDAPAEAPAEGGNGAVIVVVIAVVVVLAVVLVIVLSKKKK